MNDGNSKVKDKGSVSLTLNNPHAVWGYWKTVD